MKLRDRPALAALPRIHLRNLLHCMSLKVALKSLLSAGLLGLLTGVLRM